jgi:hypothetical protein
LHEHETQETTAAQWFLERTPKWAVQYHAGVFWFVQYKKEKPMSESMTQDEFCAEEHISRPTAQRYRREGTGPAFYRLPGGGVRYLRRDVESWRAARRFEAA